MLRAARVATFQGCSHGGRRFSMTERAALLSVIGLALGLAGCSSSGTTDKGTSASSGGSSSSSSGGAEAGVGGSSSAGGSGSSAGGSSSGSGGSSPGSGGSGASADAGTAARATYAEVKAWAEAYKKAHPGSGGKDWDINALDLNGNFIHDDPDARRLRSICGPGQLPIIPMIAWEYGGSDHQWVTPDLAALVYCVYTPANPGTEHWTLDGATQTTTADMYVLFPDQNPCKDKAGADQVMACLGDPAALNIEIIVDTVNFNDGHSVGLDVSATPTEVYLIQASGQKVHLYSSP